MGSRKLWTISLGLLIILVGYFCLSAYAPSTIAITTNKGYIRVLVFYLVMSSWPTSLPPPTELIQTTSDIDRRRQQNQQSTTKAAHWKPRYKTRRTFPTSAPTPTPTRGTERKTRRDAWAMIMIKEMMISPTLSSPCDSIVVDTDWEEIDDDGVGYCSLKVWAVRACKYHHTGYLASIAASIGGLHWGHMRWILATEDCGLSLSAIASTEEEREPQLQFLFDMSWVESGDWRIESDGSWETEPQYIQPLDGFRSIPTSLLDFYRYFWWGQYCTSRRAVVSGLWFSGQWPLRRCSFSGGRSLSLLSRYNSLCVVRRELWSWCFVMYDGSDDGCVGSSISFRSAWFFS